MEDAIGPQPGNANDPKKFVGRRRITDTALEMLRSGLNLLLNDPRRMGKTFWLTHLKAEANDFETFIIDYEGVGSVEDFLLTTLGGLSKGTGAWTKAKHTLSGYFEGLEVGGGPLKIRVAAQHQSRLKLLTDVLTTIEKNADITVLICMDELPVAIQNIAEHSPRDARELLQVLRSLRLKLPRVRWVLAGSIGFHHVIRACGATEGDVNDLQAIHLGPLSETDSAELVRRLGLGIGRIFVDEASAQMYRRTDGVPFFLHQVAKCLDTGSPDPVTASEVDDAMEGYIDDLDESRPYAHILTRVDLRFGADEASIAEAILDSMALTLDRWVSVDTLVTEAGPTPVPIDRLTKLLDLLVSDHYLVKRGRNYRWRYGALRYFWARRRNLVDRP